MRPLEGVRVLAFESFGAGPYGSMFLADLGAEVIKIENPHVGGDPSRHMGPVYLGENDSTYFQSFNLNKRSMTLDLKQEAGRAVLNKLVETADATMNNLRGDLAEKLGLTYAHLGQINPKIVCAHISAYGRDNHRNTRPGYDYLMQSESGFLSLTGEPGTPPARFGLSMVDFMTGTTCALGLVSALLAVQKGQPGRDVDLSLYDLALHQTSYPASWYLNEGIVTERLPRSSHPATAPNQLFEAKDGWIFVMCMKDSFWQRLLVVLKREDLAEDPRFDSMQARVKNRAELTEVLDPTFKQRTMDEWVADLCDLIPVAPVYDLGRALDNPFAAEVEMVREVPHPERADMRLLGNPLKIDGQRLPAEPCQALGADTDVLLEELGFSEDERSSLRAKGAV